MPTHFSRLSLLALVLSFTWTCSELPTEDSHSSVPFLLKVSERIYTGGQPKTAGDFQELQALGIKTLVNVDGARPDLSLAKSYDMSYVHIPMHYDTVEPIVLLSLQRVLQERPGPFYIHCHHGKHRGPAAAALAWRMDEDVSSEEALSVLRRAGTSKNYPGLWREVEGYRSFPSTVALPPLFEVAEVGGFTRLMAEIDRTWDHVKMLKSHNWQGSSLHPDIQPQQELSIFRQQFEDAEKLAKANPAYSEDLDFMDSLGEVIALSEELESAFRKKNVSRADSILNSIRQSCKECHRSYRNGKIETSMEPKSKKKTDAEWEMTLTPEQYHILREAGTEAPFTGKYTDTEKSGTYCCAGCGSELFQSAHKFHSGCGWPSFYLPFHEGAVTEVEDLSLGSIRVEIQCTTCEGHLGHVFEDGPPPTGLRYCINSGAILLKETP
jgi:methionine-R-sulfoxide reductase